MTSEATKTPEWREFERAVAAFLAALDPTAAVLPDAHTPDRDTGLLRQRDVWIETRLFGGLLTLKILVSCKRKKAALNQQDVDAFAGELRAAGAHKGVLYSHGGFSKPALIKAGRLGISCCGLFENRPADLPQVLVLNAYCFRERVRIDLAGAAMTDLGPLLDLPLEGDPEGLTVLDRLVRDYEANAALAMTAAISEPRPTWGSDLTISVGSGPPITIKLCSGWAIFRARREAWLLNGSYSFTDNVFAGDMSSPWVDQRSAHPGPGWEAIEGDEVDESLPRVVVYSHGGEFATGLRALVARSADVAQR